MPERIQLRRTKGWRKPEGAVVVARPARWGNPFVVGAPYRNGRLPGGGVEHGTVASRAHAVNLYRGYLEDRPDLVTAIRAELAGRDLCCWCPPEAPCHVDVLLEVANAAAPAEVARA